MVHVHEIDRAFSRSLRIAQIMWEGSFQSCRIVEKRGEETGLIIYILVESSYFRYLFLYFDGIPLAIIINRIEEDECTKKIKF